MGLEATIKNGTARISFPDGREIAFVRDDKGGVCPTSKPSGRSALTDSEIRAAYRRAREVLYMREA